MPDDPDGAFLLCGFKPGMSDGPDFGDDKDGAVKGVAIMAFGAFVVSRAGENPLRRGSDSECNAKKLAAASSKQAAIAPRGFNTREAGTAFGWRDSIATSGEGAETCRATAGATSVAARRVTSSDVLAKSGCEANVEVPGGIAANEFASSACVATICKALVSSVNSPGKSVDSTEVGEGASGEGASGASSGREVFNGGEGRRSGGGTREVCRCGSMSLRKYVAAFWSRQHRNRHRVNRFV